MTQTPSKTRAVKEKGWATKFLPGGSFSQVALERCDLKYPCKGGCVTCQTRYEAVPILITEIPPTAKRTSEGRTQKRKKRGEAK